MRIVMRWVSMGMAAALLLTGFAVWAQEPAAPAQTVPEAAPPAEPVFSQEQIDQMVAPIALYPDALLAQVLMASTYPLEIVQAVRWVKKNPDLEGEALDKAASEETWDPSVKSLVFFPSVLNRMNDNLDWTQDLGDAFLAQQDDVLGAVQRLRKEAYDAGTLKTTPEQVVKSEGDVIAVQPAEPEKVYVPVYNPTTVYGSEAPPATNYYPTVYTAPPTTTYVTQPAPTTTYVTQPATTSSTDSLVSFGAGALVGGLLTAAIMWDKNDDHDHYHYGGVYYGGRGYYGRPGYWGQPGYWNNGNWRRPATLPANVNYRRNVNINTGDINVDRSRNRAAKWEHNPTHRGGVKYRDNSSRQRYAKAGGGTRVDRSTARGYRQPSAATRQARPSTAEVTQRLQRGERAQAGQRPAARPQSAQREAQRRPTERAQAPARAQAPKRAERPAQTQRPSREATRRPQQTASAQQRQRSAAQPSQRAPSQRAAAPRQSAQRSNAFQRSGNARMERAASSRGAASRASRGGGGGAQRGGGGRGGRGR